MSGGRAVITLSSVRRRQRFSALQQRIDFLRKEADQLRDTGDCDMWNLAHQSDLEADDLEAWQQMEVA